MERWTPDAPDGDAVYVRFGNDALKLLPTTGPTINHLGLEVAEPRADAHDPDNNRFTFVTT